jgi:hypothetical protein
MVATATNPSISRTDNQRFYVMMAAAFVLVAFGGFTPTYFAKVATGSFHNPPIIHIHGMLFFTWTCFFFCQTALVAAGRTPDHRTWGLAGISLFTIMMCSVLVGELTVIQHDEAIGMGDAARRFAAVTLCAWPLLVGIFTLAIIKIRRPEVHKRLMILLMAAMLTPAIARVFFTLFAPPGHVGAPAPFVSLPPALVSDLFIIIAMLRDWRTRGRPHTVYVAGGLIVLAQQALTVPLAATATWMNVVHTFERLAG